MFVCVYYILAPFYIYSPKSSHSKWITTTTRALTRSIDDADRAFNHTYLVVLVASSSSSSQFGDNIDAKSRALDCDCLSRARAVCLLCARQQSRRRRQQLVSRGLCLSNATNNHDDDDPQLTFPSLVSINR